MNEFWNEFENWPIPLINEQSLFDFCHQHNSLYFDQIFLKLADKVDMNDISHEFENLLDWIISLRVTSPLSLKKKPLFDFVISITHSVLIGSS